MLAWTVSSAVLGVPWLWPTPDSGAAFWWSHAPAFCVALCGAAALLRDKRKANARKRQGMEVEARNTT